MPDWEVIYKAVADFSDLTRESAKALAEMEAIKKAAAGITAAQLQDQPKLIAAREADVKALRAEQAGMEALLGVAQRYNQNVHWRGAVSEGQFISNLQREEQLFRLINVQKQRGFYSPQQDYAFRNQELAQQYLLNRAAQQGYATPEQYLAYLATSRHAMEQENQAWRDRVSALSAATVATATYANTVSGSHESAQQLLLGARTAAEAVQALGAQGAAPGVSLQDTQFQVALAADIAALTDFSNMTATPGVLLDDEIFRTQVAADRQRMTLLSKMTADPSVTVDSAPALSAVDQILSALLRLRNARAGLGIGVSPIVGGPVEPLRGGATAGAGPPPAFGPIDPYATEAAARAERDLAEQEGRAAAASGGLSVLQQVLADSARKLAVAEALAATALRENNKIYASGDLRRYSTDLLGANAQAVAAARAFQALTAQSDGTVASIARQAAAADVLSQAMMQFQFVQRADAAATREAVTGWDALGLSAQYADKAIADSKPTLADVAAQYTKDAAAARAFAVAQQDANNASRRSLTDLGLGAAAASHFAAEEKRAAEAAALLANAGKGGGGGGGRGPFGIPNPQIPLFAGAFGGTAVIGSISAISLGIHLLIDFLIVLVPAILTAAAGLGAFGLAASDAAKSVYTQLVGLHNVQDAFQQSIYPLTGNLERLHKAVQPQVFELFGIALTQAGKNTQTFNNLAIGTGNVLENMAAHAAVLYSRSGPGLHAFLTAGAYDLSQFAKIGSSIGGVFLTLVQAGEKTKVAETILSLLADVFRAVDVTVKALGPDVLAAGIAFFSIVHYGGAMVTLLNSVLTGVLNLTAKIPALNAASTQMARGLAVSNTQLESMASRDKGVLAVAAATDIAAPKMGAFAVSLDKAGTSLEKQARAVPGGAAALDRYGTSLDSAGKKAVSLGILAGAVGPKLDEVAGKFGGVAKGAKAAEGALTDLGNKTSAVPGFLSRIGDGAKKAGGLLGGLFGVSISAGASVIIGALAGIGIAIYGMVKLAGQQFPTFGQLYVQNVVNPLLQSYPIIRLGPQLLRQEQTALAALGAETKQLNAVLKDPSTQAAWISVFQNSKNATQAQLSQVNSTIQLGTTISQNRAIVAAAKSDYATYSQVLKAAGGNVGLLSDAGITSKDILDATAQAAAGNQEPLNQLIIKAKGAADQFVALSLGAGQSAAALNASSYAAGADSNALGAIDAAVTKLNDNEDKLFSTLIGGEQTFVAFQQGMQALSTDAHTAGTSLGGFNTQSLKYAADFYSTVLPAAQKQLDALRLQNISQKNLTTVLATQAGQLLPYARGNDTARLAIVSLINNALGPNTVSLQTLDRWVGKNTTSMAGYQAIIATTQAHASSLAGVLSGDLAKVFQQQLLVSSGAQADMQAYADALINAGASSDKTRAARANLIHDLEKIGFSAQDATNFADGQAQGLVKNTIPAFTNAGAAAKLAASEIDVQFVNALGAIINVSPQVTGDIKKFSDLIVSTGDNSTRTQGARAQLIKDLENAGLSAQTATGLVDGLQAKIDAMHGTSVSVDVHASGSGAVSATATGVVQGVQGVLKFFDAGGAVGGTGGPTQDDQLIRASTGEWVINTASVGRLQRDYGPGIMDAINSYASGGFVGLASMLPQPPSWVAAKEAEWASKIGQAFDTNAINQFTQAVQNALTAGFAQNVASSVAGNALIDGWIAQALGLTGAPGSWQPGLLTIALYESGFNPNAINLTDINAQNGDPSRGLMQLIMTTFDAYHQPGTSWNIYDPIANIAAAINYIRAVYGDIGNVPGIKSLNAGGPYVGYASGGPIIPMAPLLAFGGQVLSFEAGGSVPSGGLLGTNVAGGAFAGSAPGSGMLAFALGGGIMGGPGRGTDPVRTPRPVGAPGPSWLPWPTALVKADATQLAELGKFRSLEKLMGFHLPGMLVGEQQQAQRDWGIFQGQSNPFLLRQGSFANLLAALGSYESYLGGPQAATMRSRFGPAVSALRGALHAEGVAVGAAQRSWMHSYGPHGYPATPGPGRLPFANQFVVPGANLPQPVNVPPGAFDFGHASGGPVRRRVASVLSQLSPMASTSMAVPDGGWSSASPGSDGYAAADWNQAQAAQAQAQSSDGSATSIIYDIDVHNPVPEQASTSIAHEVQKLAFLAGRGVA